MIAVGRKAALDELSKTLENAQGQAKGLAEHTVFYLIQMALNELREEPHRTGWQLRQDVLRLDEDAA